uniref:EF-hand domain-containing protein n=1 Tax=Denticeps clupeoides TaxID=299321 RepID=A0AAY4CJU9_9TELE
MGQSQGSGNQEVALDQIQELYRRFASECPSGKLHLHEFKRIFGVSSESSAEESAYMENVFRSFDSNQDNTIDFMEYVAAVHLVLRGRLEDKLRWSFKVFDRDGNGQENVLFIISKIKKHENPPCATPEQICHRIFELVDKNNDGQISLDEFMEGAQQDSWVMEQLRLDVRPTGWFIEHQTQKC